MELVSFMLSLAVVVLLVFPLTAEAVVDECDGILVSELLPTLIDPGPLYQHLQTVQSFAHKNNGTRVVGSRGHNLTIDYIIGKLRARGYYVETQRFSGLARVFDAANLSINGHSVHAEALEWSPVCNFTSLPVVTMNRTGCELAHYPDEINGAIALVSRDGCSLSEKSKAAGDAGAAVLLVHESTQLVPSLDRWDTNHIPSLKISDTDVEPFLASHERLRGNVMINTKYRNVTSAGINDNGSGVASLLEVAIQLSRFRTSSRVKFAFWTAAESGLLGSRRWVAGTYPEELRKIRLYLDINMVASPNGVLRIYDGNGTLSRRPGPFGSAAAQATLEDAFRAQRRNFSRTQINNRSDYAPFYESHIPFGGLFSGANGLKTEDEARLFGGHVGTTYDANYRRPGDNITNVNMTTLLANARTLAHAVGIYGKSIQSFPIPGTLPVPAEGEKGAGGCHMELPTQSLGWVTLAWTACWALSWAL
ncbi:hypothetical protein GGS23DRAFT_619075 [Durotheca rogersii]|uniref:uncharacterized protein n=1 Tax=Durotheca rogersii TaxID=419775 RepID=UPI00221FDBB6|nr:uncharacterized protein GGS23DRAFT_619075 [Durotheca rogersii]KAI5864489.1 hypothetical protein GGS23DRAFT_619075 [Durotheca rogersii]